MKKNDVLNMYLMSLPERKFKDQLRVFDFIAESLGLKKFDDDFLKSLSLKILSFSKGEADQFIKTYKIMLLRFYSCSYVNTVISVIRSFYLYALRIFMISYTPNLDPVFYYGKKTIDFDERFFNLTGGFYE